MQKIPSPLTPAHALQTGRSCKETCSVTLVCLLYMELLFSREISLSRFLAHLSRRLIGELIVYPCSGVCRHCRGRPPFSNVFSSVTAWPIKAKFYVEPPWEGGTKVCINGPGHMTKMAAMPIYGKNPSKIFFSRTSGPISMKLGL